MTARDEILRRLQSTPTKLPALKPRIRQYHNLGEQFAAALAQSKGEAHLVESKKAAVGKLRELLAELEIETVAAHREAPLADLGIPEAFPDLHWFFAGETADYLSRCAQADLGLTSADFALAETGSLVLTSGKHKARMTSLLPPVHIVLLPQSRILPSIFEWVGKRPQIFPANLVLVSGPSKTGDIEQTSIVGVHGPKRFIVIVYQDRDE
ncbi:MAG: lactate utilization protein [Anaerolineales bacterium]|nr:lactate utilization protein [Anaerolineales bacterium]